MKISELKYRIEIQEKVIQNDDIGGFNENWQKVKTVYGKIEFQNVSQYVVAQKIVRERSVKITIRKTHIDESIHRLYSEGKIYKIQFIHFNNDNFYEITCSCVI